MTDSNTQQSIISVILPTRKRAELLERCITSLMEKADHPSFVEIMVGVDSDDKETIAFVNDTLPELIKKIGCTCKAKLFEPSGYKNLQDVYFNGLISVSKGEWLFTWCDDGLMESQGWDTKIREFDGTFKFIALKDNHNHPYGLFFCVPRDWFVLFDLLAPSIHADSWMSIVAIMNGIFERIDVTVFHDRFDLTGNNNDETFANRDYQEGNPHIEGDFDHVDMKRERMNHAEKINWFLKKIGQTKSPTHFELFKAGKLDPFSDIFKK